MTIDWTTAQWGIASGGFWGDLPLTNPGSEVALGAIDAGLLFDASAHQSLNPKPTLTGFRFDATFSRWDIGTTDTQLELGLVPTPTPALYSNGALPWQRSEVSLGVFALDLLEHPTALRLSLELPIAIIDAFCTGSPSWSGRVALSLRGAGAHLFYVYNYAGQLITAATEQTVPAPIEPPPPIAGRRPLRWRTREVYSRVKNQWGEWVPGHYG